MASLPTYDPNKAEDHHQRGAVQPRDLGVYEMGSTFKIFNTAMALDSGKVDARRACFDAHVADQDRPLHDQRLPWQHRSLTVPEIFTYSSNIGSAKMAVDVMGPEAPAGVLRQDRLAEAAHHSSCPESPAPL